MATMKFALVSLTLFLLLEDYNARCLHDISIKGSFDGQQVFQESIIKMVTGQEQHRLPPSHPSSPSSSHDQTTYGRDNLPPPPPKVAPPKVQATYKRDNPSSPSPPKVAPSTGQGTYGREASSPPPPNEAPTGQQTFYGEDKPSSKQDSSPEHTKYGRDDPRDPPSPPNEAPTDQQTFYG